MSDERVVDRANVVVNDVPVLDNDVAVVVNYTALIDRLSRSRIACSLVVHSPVGSMTFAPYEQRFDGDPSTNKSVLKNSYFDSFNIDVMELGESFQAWLDDRQEFTNPLTTHGIPLKHFPFPRDYEILNEAGTESATLETLLVPMTRVHDETWAEPFEAAMTVDVRQLDITVYQMHEGIYYKFSARPDWSRVRLRITAEGDVVLDPTLIVEIKKAGILSNLAGFRGDSWDNISQQISKYHEATKFVILSDYLVVIFIIKHGSGQYEYYYETGSRRKSLILYALRRSTEEYNREYPPPTDPATIIRYKAERQRFATEGMMNGFSDRDLYPTNVEAPQRGRRRGLIPPSALPAFSQSSDSGSAGSWQALSHVEVGKVLHIRPLSMVLFKKRVHRTPSPAMRRTFVALNSTIRPEAYNDASTLNGNKSLLSEHNTDEFNFLAQDKSKSSDSTDQGGVSPSRPSTVSHTRPSSGMVDLLLATEQQHGKAYRPFPARLVQSLGARQACVTIREVLMSSEDNRVLKCQLSDKSMDQTFFVLKVFKNDWRRKKEKKAYEVLADEQGNLVPYMLGEFRVDKTKCLAMEFLDGQPLSRWAEDNCSSVGSIREFFGKWEHRFFTLLAYGLRHGDLSAHNIILTAGKPVIFDFEFARAATAIAEDVRRLRSSLFSWVKKDKQDTDLEQIAMGRAFIAKAKLVMAMAQA